MRVTAEQRSSRSRTALKAFGILGAVLVVVAVLHSQTSGAPVKSAIQMGDKNEKAGVLEFVSKLESSQLACVDSLNERLAAHNDEKLKDVTVSRDAVYSFTNDEGRPMEVGFEEGMASRGRMLQMGVPVQVAPADEDGSHSIKVLYGDNTVVTAHVDGCKVTGLYEATQSGQIDPSVRAGFEEDETEEDEGVEAAEDEPGLGGDIAYGTKPKDTSKFPWTVRVGNPGRRGRSGKGFCSGEIISQYYVVTSKHCTDGKANNGLEIVAGAKKIRRRKSQKNRQVRRSNRIWRHPQEDIALVRVSKKFNYNKYVNKVPRFASYKATNMLVYASGYGARSKYGGMTNRFKYASMYIKSDAFCKNHRSSFVVGREVCCSGGSGNTCGGDSGGPLVFYRKGKYNLVGINSWSITSCRKKKSNVDVFESIPYLRGWVLDTMGTNYGWSSVVLNSNGRCTQARWRKQGATYVKTSTRTVGC